MQLQQCYCNNNRTARTTTNPRDKRNNNNVVSYPNTNVSQQRKHLLLKRQRSTTLRQTIVTMLLLSLSLLNLTITTLCSAQPIPIRINCGGPLIIDSTNGNTRWEGDTTYNVDNKGLRRNLCSNTTVVNAIQNRSAFIPAPIYCSQRFYRIDDIPPYQYSIPVPNNARYYIRLHFAELMLKTVNSRLMNIYIENTLVLNNLDVVAVTGGSYLHAYMVMITQPFTITDGAVTITLNSTKNRPMISGIEVLPPANIVVQRINCGSTVNTTTADGIVWSRDQYAQSGGLYNTCGTITNSIYCTSRFFKTTRGTPFRYNIPVPYNNAPYRVRLHFAEQFHDAPNDRIFDIFIEGTLVIDNLDIMVNVARNTPYVIDITSMFVVTDSVLTIDFVGLINDPTINGIEVIYVGAPLGLGGALISPPIAAPVAPPVTAPVTPPIVAPVPPPVSGPTASFQDIVINCGGPLYIEQSGSRTWIADSYFTGGNTYSLSSVSIENTVDDPIYLSERVGTFSYSIPVPNGNYEVNIHLAEIVFTNPGTRIFDLVVETEAFSAVDIFALAGGRNRAVKLEANIAVTDGFVTISVVGIKAEPKINGIEIKAAAPHLAHSVSNGPYFGVDRNNVNSATVRVDGSESHTHGQGLSLTQWVWKRGATVIGTGEIANINVPVGTTDITLTVTDSGNNVATEATTVTVHPFGFPDITSMTPVSGNIAGGTTVTITGSGFTYTSAETIVYFGLDQLTGAAIVIVSSTTIRVTSPAIPIGIPVDVSVETPRGRSASQTFTYTSSIPISFATSLLLNMTGPTSADFGPDMKLYVTTASGTLTKISMNDAFTTITGMVSAAVLPGRAILGIAFDPFDAGNPNPPIYVSSSLLFHGESNSSSGQAINGKISRITGANLDVVEDIVTGLPVCDLDHAVNQITFGNNGELYINIGSNTNGGLPGRLSGSGKQKENYFSASSVVAKLADPAFDGFIEYDALDDGSPINMNGVSVFAPGLRNPFGLVQHSNGNLYATDNGPNTGYGRMKTGCGTESITDQQREDKLVHLIQNKYYGHPNPKRATYHNDPRQCVWRNPTDPTSVNYEAPLGVLLSSATGIIEYQADVFNKQLRGNLIHVKYKSGLRRTVLSPDGSSVNPLTIPGVALVGRDGLDVAQAPNGNLIEVRYIRNSIYVNRPVEATTTVLRVSAVFPTRGSRVGGTRLRIYGLNFGTSPTVSIGGTSCPIIGAITTSHIDCTIPGKAEGLYDVVVSSSTGSYTFEKGYRYILGF